MSIKSVLKNFFIAIVFVAIFVAFFFGIPFYGYYLFDLKGLFGGCFIVMVLMVFVGLCFDDVP